MRYPGRLRLPWAITRKGGIILLVVNFYQIPYIFEGILPYLIRAGFILLPVFGIGTLVSWYKLIQAREAFESAQLVMLEDMYQRLKGSN